MKKKILPLDCISAKVKHSTQIEAERSARDSQYRGAPKLYVYKCRDCDGWHLTSRNPN